MSVTLLAATASREKQGRWRWYDRAMLWRAYVAYFWVAALCVAALALIGVDKYAAIWIAIALGLATACVLLIRLRRRDLRMKRRVE